MEKLSNVALLAQSEYDYSTTRELSGEEATAIFGVTAVVFLILTLLVLIPGLITLWKLFEKAGRPGWAAIVPVYSTMVLAEIAGKPTWMGVVAGVGGLLGLIPVIGAIGSIAALIFLIIIFIDFIPKYNQGAGFWVAFFLFPLICLFMLKDLQFKGGATADAAAQQPPVAPQDPTGPQTPGAPPVV